MTDKTVLIGGAVALGIVVLLFLSKKSQQNLQAQQLALSGQYANTTAGQVGGIISSIGSFFNSGALDSLKDSFLDTGSANEPGLITPSSSSSSNSSAANLNTPGLNSPTYVNYGPVALPSDLSGSSSDEDIYG